MAVRLDLGLRIPLVKLDIDLNDRTSRVILQQDHLTFSNDDKGVYLRYDTVEKLCRQNKKISPSAKL